MGFLNKRFLHSVRLSVKKKIKFNNFDFVITTLPRENQFFSRMNFSIVKDSIV